MNNKTEFERFLDLLDDYLYSEGWYVQGTFIKQRGFVTYKEVEDYLVEHCYSRKEAQEIIQGIASQILP